MERWTWHGGGLRSAKAHYGEGTAPWIDLSTGINPHSWPIPAMDFDWRCLPDEAALCALETAAAQCFGLDPDFVCAVPGTEIGLRLVGSLLSGPAFHIDPSYRTHSAMIADSTTVNPERLSEARGATLILANPNNPDGRLVEREVMFNLLDQRGDTGWLLIDEAFADTHPHASMASAICADRRLIAFRSFGKFFGLAGVRLGFVLGPPPILAAVRKKLGAWPLSAAAIAIGHAAYSDAAWIAEMRHRLFEEAARLDELLIHAGFSPVGACPLFRLIETEDAHALFDRLARHSILTRPFAEHPTWLRIGLPASDAERHRLDSALRHG